MAEALFDLEEVLRSKKHKFTQEELSVLHTCKAKAINSFGVGACVASGVVWLATRRLSSKFLRINLSVGAGVITGMWRFGSSIDSSLDNILSLDGSRMQKELATLIVDKYKDNSGRMQLMSKHFYSEKVFDDSTTDQPKLRWRFRNFSGDNIASHQKTDDGRKTKDGQKTNVSNSHTDSSNTKTNSDIRPIPVNRGVVDAMSDPLDCVFGFPESREQIHQPEGNSGKPRAVNRSHRRLHRRHRMRHQEGSSNAQHV